MENSTLSGTANRYFWSSFSSSGNIQISIFILSVCFLREKICNMLFFKKSKFKAAIHLNYSISASIFIPYHKNQKRAN